MTADPEDLPDPLALLASTLHLMTLYAKTGCPRDIPLIRRQLGCLERYPEERLPAFLKVVAQRLTADWQGIAFTSQPAGHPATLH